MQTDELQYLSTREAGDLLGVSVSTIKRWVDTNVLPAHRTAGGHRKLLRAEVLALAREGTLPRGDLMAGARPSPKGRPVDLAQASQELWRCLNEGQSAEAAALLRRAYRSGVSLDALADGVIAPAMARVGHDWETERIDIWQEHHGTQLCMSALFQLKQELEHRAERNRPLALGAAPEGDPYLLPTLLAQYVLLDAGWEAINLGPNTPLTSLAKALRDLQPKLIWLSVSYLQDRATFVEAYQDLFHAAQGQGTAVAIGGQALDAPLRSSLSYTTYGDRMAQLADFARQLHPRPQRPRRGRPSQGRKK